MKFNPCRGGAFCTQEGTHCGGCGRSHEEIAETRQLMDTVAQFALKMGYENIEEFTEFVGIKSAGKARFIQTQENGGIPLS